MMTKKTEIKETKNSGDLRRLLLEELQELRQGNRHPTHSNAVARLSGSIVSTVNLELQYHTHLSKTDGAETKPVSF